VQAMRIRKGQLEFTAPHGFQDVFSLRVRSNNVLVNQIIYDKKAIKWKELWPKLSVENW
jgi:hypothetical protein